MINKLLFTYAEAAQALGLSRSTVYGLVERGELKGLKIGRAARIPAASLQDFVQRKLGHTADECIRS